MEERAVQHQTPEGQLAEGNERRKRAEGPREEKGESPRLNQSQAEERREGGIQPARTAGREGGGTERGPGSEGAESGRTPRKAASEKGHSAGELAGGFTRGFAPTMPDRLALEKTWSRIRAVTRRVTAEGFVDTGAPRAAAPLPLFRSGAPTFEVNENTVRSYDDALKDSGMDVTELFKAAAARCPAFAVGFALRSRAEIRHRFPAFDSKILDEITTSGVQLNLLAPPGKQSEIERHAAPRFSSDSDYTALQTAAQKEFNQGWGIVISTRLALKLKAIRFTPRFPVPKKGSTDCRPVYNYSKPSLKEATEVSHRLTGKYKLANSINAMSAVDSLPEPRLKHVLYRLFKNCLRLSATFTGPNDFLVIGLNDAASAYNQISARPSQAAMLAYKLDRKGLFTGLSGRLRMGLRFSGHIFAHLSDMIAQRASNRSSEDPLWCPDIPFAAEAQVEDPTGTVQTHATADGFNPITSRDRSRTLATEAYLDDFMSVSLASTAIASFLTFLDTFWAIFCPTLLANSAFAKPALNAKKMVHFRAEAECIGVRVNVRKLTATITPSRATDILTVLSLLFPPGVEHCKTAALPSLFGKLFNVSLIRFEGRVEMARLFACMTLNAVDAFGNMRLEQEELEIITRWCEWLKSPSVTRMSDLVERKPTVFGATDASGQRGNGGLGGFWGLLGHLYCWRHKLSDAVTNALTRGQIDCRACMGEVELGGTAAGLRMFPAAAKAAGVQVNGQVALLYSDNSSAKVWCNKRRPG